MADYTENFNLKKPARTDKFSIADFNKNMDKIDSAIKENSRGGGNAPATAYLYQQIMPETVFAMPITDEFDLMSLTWEQGTITSSGDGSSSSYIRNAGYIDVDASAMYCLKIDITDTDGNGLIWNPMCYDENKLLIKDDGWVNSATVYTLPTSTKYLRMVVKKTSGNMTVSQLGTAKIIKYV